MLPQGEERDAAAVTSSTKAGRPPEPQAVRPGQARLAWHALFISAPDVQFLSDIKDPSLEFLSLSFFGHTTIFHESLFLFHLLLRTLVHRAYGVCGRG